MKAYIEGQMKLEREADQKHQAYKGEVSRIEEHRKAFQAKGLVTEAIDAAKKIRNSKTPKARYAYLRTFDIARRLLKLDDQGDMFSDHVDEGEARAISNAAA
jgi:hypothetical protein